MTDEVEEIGSKGAADMGLIAYFCYAISIIPMLQIGIIAGLVIAYTQRAAAEGSWRESHYEWLIRTFWIGIVFAGLATVLSFATWGILSGLAYGGLVVWYAIRLFVGWKGYSSKIAIANPDSLLFG